jgi:uncharacterized RDD family membrane protein YckC
LFEASLARQPEIVEATPTAEPDRQPRRAAQGVLFTAHEARQGEQFRTKVVSLDDYREAGTRPKRRAPAARNRPVGRALPPLDAEAQQTLFSENTDAPVISVSAPLPETGLRCDAVVAPLLQRATAAALDVAMVCLAEGLLLLALYASPASAFISGRTLPGLAMFGLFLAFGYKMIFALAECDSPGTRWTLLRVLNFDGQPPTRNERLARLAGGLLSISAAGLGLIWALVDEETLSWHDHISKTFAASSQR